MSTDRDAKRRDFYIVCDGRHTSEIILSLDSARRVMAEALAHETCSGCLYIAGWDREDGDVGVIVEISCSDPQCSIAVGDLIPLSSTYNASMMRLPTAGE